MGRTFKKKDSTYKIVTSVLPTLTKIIQSKDKLLIYKQVFIAIY